MPFASFIALSLVAIITAISGGWYIAIACTLVAIFILASKVHVHYWGRSRRSRM